MHDRYRYRSSKKLLYNLLFSAWQDHTALATSLPQLHVFSNFDMRHHTFLDLQAVPDLWHLPVYLPLSHPADPLSLLPPC